MSRKDYIKYERITIYLRTNGYKANEFQTYIEAYKIVNELMIFYNERRLHSSLKYMPPREFYALYLEEHLEKFFIKI
ncbi:integrase core domain-containing protein [Clostridium sp. JS66]|uniref:integrase core domain-containing protein n=1 Tax=Clostridium sp. JS66 TaxID=3064705 RepID=UPI00399A7E90